MLKYFKRPTQVRFDDGDDNVCCGIAFQDYIICACCGEVLSIESVTILKEFDKYWVDFSDYIDEE